MPHPWCWLWSSDLFSSLDRIWRSVLQCLFRVHPGLASWSSWVKSESEDHSVVSDSLRPNGLYSSWNSPGQNTGVGSLSLLQGDLPDAGIEPRSPTLQGDSFPAEPQGKPKNTGVGGLSLLQRIFPSQESNQGLLHHRWILYQLSYEGSPHGWKGMRYWWNRASQVA